MKVPSNWQKLPNNKRIWLYKLQPLQKKQQKDCATQKANIEACVSAHENGAITVSQALEFFDDCNKDAEHYHQKCKKLTKELATVPKAKRGKCTSAAGSSNDHTKLKEELEEAKNNAQYWLEMADISQQAHLKADKKFKRQQKFKQINKTLLKRKLKEVLAKNDKLEKEKAE